MRLQAQTATTVRVPLNSRPRRDARRKRPLSAGAAASPRFETLEDRLLLAALPTGFSETVVASGLSNATAMEIAPNGDIWVLEQAGNVKRFRSGTTTADVVGNLAGLGLSSSGERGVLGIAFDPNYASNKFVYLYYTSTATPNPHNRISRFTVNDASSTDYFFLGTTSGGTAGNPTQFIISDLDALSGATNHNGGAMHFGLDGMLYVAVGENANGSHAQTLANRHGKMLRLNVNFDDFPSDPNQNYRIPTDNPFFSTATGHNRVIWALGLRNPFTFAFQPVTGRMFINDVGQNTWEEINDGIAGSNYGWPGIEGNAGTAPTSPGTYRAPFYTYDHGGAEPNGVAITGGAFYSPTTLQFPSQYHNDYFFADFGSNEIWHVDLNSKVATEFASGISAPVDLKVDSAGNLYYLARGSNQVFRVSFTSAPPSISDHPDAQTITIGAPVTFSVVATGAGPLTYQWQRADLGAQFANIGGANGTSFTIPSVQASDHQDLFRVIVTDTFGRPTTSNAAMLTVTSNQPPSAVINITAGLRNGRWDAGATVNFSGSATDPEQGTLGASSFSWRVDYLTTINGGDADSDGLPGITRPFLPNFGNTTTGSFTPAVTGPYTLADVAHVITLTVTDAQGLQDVERLVINPNTANLTVTTTPTGLQVTVDGQPFTAPTTFGSVVGFQRPIGAATSQSIGGTTYTFVSWSDGGAATHTIATPTTNTTYTATYQASQSQQPPVLAAIGNQTLATSTQNLVLQLAASDPNNDPLTFSAQGQSLAYHLDQTLGLTFNGNYDQNWGGRNEKWMPDSGGQYYYIVPDGRLFRWLGTPNLANDPLVDTLDAAHWQNPALLHSAAANNAPAAISVNGDALTINPNDTFAGRFVVTAMVSDGQGGSDSETVFVTVQSTGQNPNQPPVLAAIGNQTMPSSTQNLVLQLGATDPNNDPLTFTAQAQSFAYHVDQTLGLTFNGNYDQNWGGRNEKWMLGTGNQYYYIVPDGRLFRWLGSANLSNDPLVETLDAGHWQNPALLHDAAATNAPAAVSVNGSALTINPNDGFTGRFVVTANVSDGQGGSDSETFTVTVQSAGQDTTPPVITNRNPGPGGTVTSSTANLDITFSEAVVGVDVTDLVLTGAGAAGASLASPLHLGGNLWRFTVSNLQNGLVIANLASDPNDIEDAAGNDLGASSWSFNVSIGTASQPPVLAPIGTQTMPTTQDTKQVTLSASDPNNDPLTFSATAHSLAYELDQTLNLTFNGNYDQNWGGRNEKWMQGNGGVWYYIVPDGRLFRWLGSGNLANDPLIDTLDASYWNNPALLHNATPTPVPAVVSVAGNVLTLNPNNGFSGAFYVTVTVSDGNGGSDFEKFRVNVTA